MWMRVLKSNKVLDAIKSKNTSHHRVLRIFKLRVVESRSADSLCRCVAGYTVYTLRVHRAPYKAQSPFQGATPARTEARSSHRYDFLEGQDGGLHEKEVWKSALARSVRPTVHKRPDAARPRKTAFALDLHQPFRAPGLCLDGTTTQLIELILTNALGFRRGPSSSQSSAHRVRTYVRFVVHTCAFGLLVARSSR